MVRITHCGDYGDMVAAMPTIIHRGEKCWFLLYDNGQTKGILNRAHIIRPLLETQPLIESVRPWRNEKVDWASEGFRPRWHNCIDSLAMCHAKHAFDSGFLSSLPDLSKPWLVAEPDKNFGGNIIINRSDRYQNNYFQWASIVKHYGERLLFIGMPDEHQRFVAKFGNVRYLITKDMLEVAKAIAGSALFIGNQSSCMTIAEGLKHPRIQETCLHIPDCIYPPSNAQYVATGEVVLPDIDGSGTISLRAPVPIPDGVETPPGGWQYPGIPNGIQHPNVAVNFLRQQKPELTPAQAREAIMIYNAERIPAFFDKGGMIKDTTKYRLALQNANTSP